MSAENTGSKFPPDTPIRCGDVVLHRPSGEAWTVAYVEFGYLAWFGWPNGEVHLSECELVDRCDDAGHLKAVDEWRQSRPDRDSRHYDRRRATVLRLYGTPEERGVSQTWYEAL